MLTYGSLQPGGSLTALYPGDTMTLFNGTEAPAVGLASLAFERSPMASTDAGSTYSASGMPAGMTLDVQVANVDAAGNYTTVAQMTADANGNSAVTDAGRAKFARISMSAYTSGAMPIVTVQR